MAKPMKTMIGATLGVALMILGGSSYLALHFVASLGPGGFTATPFTAPPPPPPPDFVPYHAENISKTSLAAVYGVTAKETFKKHPEVIAAFKAADASATPATFSSGLESMGIFFADDHQALVFFGTSTVGAYDLSANKAYAITGQSGSDAGVVFYGSPDSSYTRVLREGFAALMAKKER